MAVSDEQGDPEGMRDERTDRTPRSPARGVLRSYPGTRTLVPALLAAVAYVDPGNFGVNIASGAEHGYALVWVVVFASGSAMVIQYLAAKLGIATGRSLAELSAERYPGVGRILLWLQAEAVVIMTDLAEIVGGALGFQLLFGWPLIVGALLVTVFSLVVLALKVRGRSHFEGVVLVLLVVIIGALLWQVFVAPVDRMALLRGALPGALDSSGVLLAVGIIGATVMPHALHFHSAASRFANDGTSAGAGGRRVTAGRRAVRSIVIALTIAAAGNISLVVFSADLPAAAGQSLETAYSALLAQTGEAAAVMLGVALLASGLAATLVGVQTGDVVMQGFGRRPIPAVVRRLLAVVPCLIVLALGVNPTEALILSQVVLSFALPGTLIPLLILTKDKRLMGALTNRPVTTAVASLITGVIVVLCAVLLVIG